MDAPPAAALPPWRSLLRGAREREGRSPLSRWLQLATVAVDGTPRVRTLVFRGWGGPASLDLLTDSRSSKAAELEHQPAAELCWLLPKARCQFRLRGRHLLLPQEQDQEQRLRLWRQLTPSGRSLWAWPPPGQPLDRSAPFPSALEEGLDQPESFLLLRFELSQVELLELGPQPHHRRRWRAASGWLEEWLNP